MANARAPIVVFTSFGVGLGTSKNNVILARHDRRRLKAASAAMWKLKMRNVLTEPVGAPHVSGIFSSGRTDSADGGTLAAHRHLSPRDESSAGTGAGNDCRTGPHPAGSGFDRNFEYNDGVNIWGSAFLPEIRKNIFDNCGKCR